jgi:hypothetical protein
MQVPPPSDAALAPSRNEFKLATKPLLVNPLHVCQYSEISIWPLTRTFSTRGTMLEDSNHLVFRISSIFRELLVCSQLKPNSFPNVWETHFHIGLDAVPVQRVARYRQIRWPFYHQFTVITTVKIPPSALNPEMFSLQTTEGRRVLLDDLDLR